MNKKESLIVQFVYLSPAPRLSDFRLRPIGAAEFSRNFASILLLAHYLEESGSEHVLSNQSIQQPWSSNQVAKDPVVSKQCSLVQAVVWQGGSIGLSTTISETFPLLAPAKKEHQPKECFWVVDLQTNYVLSVGEDFNVARNKFDEFISQFREQI